MKMGLRIGSGIGILGLLLGSGLVCLDLFRLLCEISHFSSSSSSLVVGYGATTFPALTEAFTFEKNATLAKLEAKKLENLIDDLTRKLKE